jgi:hypothetical protein
VALSADPLQIVRASAGVVLKDTIANMATTAATDEMSDNFIWTSKTSNGNGVQSIDLIA